MYMIAVQGVGEKPFRYNVLDTKGEGGTLPRWRFFLEI